MYEKLFNKFLYPFYETRIKHRQSIEYLNLLEENQWLSFDEIKKSQWDSLKRLITHAYKQSPYYKNLFDQCALMPQDISCYDDFLQLPVCSRQDLVENKEKMIATNYRGKVINKSTGGSTGVPVHFALNDDSNQWRTAAAQRGYRWAGCGPGQPTVYIWGVDVGDPTTLAKVKTNLYHWAYNRKMFNCFDFDEIEMKKCIDYLRKRKPNGIVAFTSAVYNLAKFAEENSITDCSVPAVITGAEKLYDHQRELIERALHTKVFNTYGCREFMLIAAECDRHEGLHTTIDNLFVEILKDGKPALPGESGDVVITDLHNYGMPFIRYKNGDIAVQGEKPCSCGRGLPLIKNIEGRKMDEIVATDGKLVSGGFFPHLMKEFPEIDKYQVIQKARDRLVIKLVLKKPLSDQQILFYKNEIKKVLGDNMTIENSIVDDIPLTRTGKYRTTISEIAH